MNTQKSIELFRRWYVEPINKLKELPDGNGGFVCLLTGLVLYERLIKAKLKTKNLPTTDEAVQKAIEEDLRLSANHRKIFWDMIRNGMAHQGMPKVGKTGLIFRDDFSEFPEFKLIEGNMYIVLNPWKFTNRVLGKFLENPMLLDYSERYPFASIINLGC